MKDATLAKLEFAIRAIHDGGTYLAPTVSKRLVDAYLTKQGADTTGFGG